MARGAKILGYGLITKGGGRHSFATAKDAVFTSLYVSPDERGNGLGKLLVEFLCLEFERKEYEKAYECIRNDNFPSIKSAERNGFVKIANAEQKNLLFLHYR